MANDITSDEIMAFLEAHPGWVRSESSISRTFVFTDFIEATGFVVRIAMASEVADHHPDIDIRWNKVTCVLSTHSEGALTSKDLDLAERYSPIPWAHCGIYRISNPGFTAGYTGSATLGTGSARACFRSVGSLRGIPDEQPWVSEKGLEAEAVEHLVGALPVLLDLHTQLEEDLRTEEVLEVLAGFGADGLDHRSALANRHTLL